MNLWHWGLTRILHFAEIYGTVFVLFQTDEEMSHRVKKNRRSEDYNYWKKCSIEYLRTQELEEKKERMAALHAEMWACHQFVMNLITKVSVNLHWMTENGNRLCTLFFYVYTVTVLLILCLLVFLLIANQMGFKYQEAAGLEKMTCCFELR